ncbi:sodium-translocating pyrophosphatase [Segatella copri]|jgi:K(+)-stimulated pyrophosphate-energized sodium pump|uniref:Putative K(+)-stimulated pyrophosphate-energized sodium pump n=1 Tax=Segatella copri TaxID=165179 RepID=A0A6G1U0M0_9BACT|nr:sodium-translocating pyrophosphatase [Segatella copri]MBV3402962.1 sodium-translocating pyrophosphatase [Segatella copri]MBW0048900.1 sodium-translocating pyrophosphatase [Segatella copri]MQN80580.1 sodium-translocating pyrophosphatase [Segatella copri]
MNNIPLVFWLIPIASVVALGMAWFFFRSMMKEDEGTERMKEIAAHVRKGAMAYLKQQYKVVTIVFVVLAIVFAFMAYVLKVQNPWVPFAFLTGGLFSGLAGFFGMKTATYASARTAHGARTGLDKGLKIAFRSGAVMGLVVVGLGLLDIAIWFIVLNAVYAGESTALITITTTMLTFGMGASTQALFARVGGGIYTKAADVGADLVGKVEANIPEDDPRNPATIADNVGDNVGDVAGMGADLYESYCGSILSTAALGATAFAMNSDMQLRAVIAPMIIAAIGIFLSLIGIYLVRTKEGASMKDLLHSLGLGTNVSAGLIAVATFIILYLLGIENWLGLSFSVISGLVAGVIIGQATEYYTSQSYKPTQKIAEASQTGPATVIIKGIGTGMISTMVPVVTISVAIMLSFLCANGFDMSMSAKSISTGLYGIGIAAVGMLSTLGITLATDAYGPIADNAGGNAEMSGLGKEVRERTDALDALGNTTAATGKGFAIGSAALTALALLASYIEEIKIAMIRAVENGKQYVDAAGNLFDPSNASTIDFINFFQVNLINPKVLVGAFLGAMAAFLFCGLTMGAVGRAAESMVQEVRRQFREIKGILEGKATPDYGRCVEISTRSAQREMIIPSLLAIIIPIVVGLVLGVAGVLGLLTGGLAAGFTLAVFMSNSGGAWDNAKKMIEEGNFGGKGSENHKATIVGDTVGDPFKDTSGPSLNILIKLMSMVSIVMAGLTIAFL